MVALEVFFRLIEIAFFLDPGQKIQCRSRRKRTGHDRDGLTCGGFRAVDLGRHQDHGRREQNAPFPRGGLFGQFLAIRVDDLDIAMEVDLDREVIVLEQGLDPFVRKCLLVHFLTVGATALFDDDQNALALGLRLGEVFLQILESVPKPLGLVKPIVAQLGGCDR